MAEEQTSRHSRLVRRGHPDKAMQEPTGFRTTVVVAGVVPQQPEALWMEALAFLVQSPELLSPMAVEVEQAGMQVPDPVAQVEVQTDARALPIPALTPQTD